MGYDDPDFDWRTQTTLKGTVSRVGQWVRGNCVCGDEDVLVYDTEDDPTLMCAECSRDRARANPRIETCDECGASHAWRDPVTGKNDFYCAQCHGKRGTVFQNRWAQAPRSLNKTGVARAQCGLRNRGTECSGEVKWRGPLNMQACNKHAGKREI